MLFHQKSVPDLDSWHKEGKGVYVSNDGFKRVSQRNGLWFPSTRESLDTEWTEQQSGYRTLTIAQLACNWKNS